MQIAAHAQAHTVHLYLCTLCIVHHYCHHRCAVLFVVNRGDCEAFRPCHEACPLFASVLKRARDAGVSVLAYEISYTVSELSSPSTSSTASAVGGKGGRSKRRSSSGG